ncbi:MAG: TIGR01212 family radical SAM protein [Deltaproteobacteria bacterium]|nr:TIGR01212 family radical SAM protein [Deltaproteobacteria bacterium]
MKRYRDFNSYLRERFGERVQKIALDAGLGCPNRDGTLSDKGCLFCDPLGSGTGAWLNEGLSIGEQIARAGKFYRERYGARKFIAYFQAFTNTYAPLSRLKTLYDQALEPEGVVGLSVGTRPDCVDRDALDLLAQYARRSLVWIEYGLQSAHDATLKRINRGHDAASFERAVLLTRRYGLNICAHIILGLPGEDRDMMMQTARFLAGLPIQGIKIHLLYVVKETPLAGLYQRGEFRCLDREEYAELVAAFLERLPPGMVVQRLTGDPGRAELVAPLWAKEKATNIRVIHETLERRNTWQGRMYGRSPDGQCR